MRFFQSIIYDGECNRDTIIAANSMEDVYGDDVLLAGDMEEFYSVLPGKVHSLEDVTDHCYIRENLLPTLYQDLLDAGWETEDAVLVAALVKEHFLAQKKASEGGASNGGV